MELDGDEKEIVADEQPKNPQVNYPVLNFVKHRKD